MGSLGNHSVSFSRMLDSFTNLIPGDGCARKKQPSVSTSWASSLPAAFIYSKGDNIELTWTRPKEGAQEGASQQMAKGTQGPIFHRALQIAVPRAPHRHTHATLFYLHPHLLSGNFWLCFFSLHLQEEAQFWQKQGKHHYIGFQIASCFVFFFLISLCLPTSHTSQVWIQAVEYILQKFLCI